MQASEVYVGLWKICACNFGTCYCFDILGDDRITGVPCEYQVTMVTSPVSTMSPW